jgi:choline dehydrogenase-like flavoprotein
MENKIYDYVIIGTGIGGGTIATLLANGGKNIALIEKGSKSHQDSNYLNKGRKLGLRTTTSIQTGGTSNLWHGVLSFLDPIDFKERPWINKSGWPIHLEDLIPYYKSISGLFGIKDFDYFFLDKISEVLKVEIESVPFNREILENKIFQQPLDVLNFKKKIKQLNNVGSVDLFENTTACKFELENNKINTLTIADKNGLKQIQGKTYILCAGTLENPRILLNSGFNNSNIGKYLMDHPMGNLCQVKFKKAQKAQIYSAKKYVPTIAIKSGLTFNPNLQKREKLPNHCFYLRPSFSEGIDMKSERVKLSLLTFKDGKIKLSDVLFVLRNINIAMQILIYKLSYNATYKYADLFFVSEQTPSEKSFVKLSETEMDEFGFPLAEVHWNVSDEDSSSIKKCFNILKEYGLSDKDYDFTHSFNDLDWENNFTSAAHHVGTCRMAKDSKNGVVDENLRAFEADNLFICDGSVFPTGGNVNNGYTIAALAARLAEYLKS